MKVKRGINNRIQSKNKLNCIRSFYLKMCKLMVKKKKSPLFVGGSRKQAKG